MRWRLFDRFAVALILYARRRKPDFVIGGEDAPYLERVYLVPKNRYLNVYLHHFRRSDDDRARHDHPWPWCSIILRNGYDEVTSDNWDVVQRVSRYIAGSVRFHASGRFAHRLVLIGDRACWSLFVTGPKTREWGFWCKKGWVHWKVFTDPKTLGATVGRGCE